MVPAIGYLTVYPCDSAPRGSSLNFTAGRTVANAVIARCRLRERVLLVFGQADVIADVSARFSVALVSFRRHRLAWSTPVVRADRGERVLEVGCSASPASRAREWRRLDERHGYQHRGGGSGYATVYPCGARPNARISTSGTARPWRTQSSPAVRLRHGVRLRVWIGRCADRRQRRVPR